MAMRQASVSRRRFAHTTSTRGISKAGQLRARMSQWISAINGYYYPYLVYHVSHERNVFPQLGIAPDEEVVAARNAES
jgi:hypothetical protein